MSTATIPSVKAVTHRPVGDTLPDAGEMDELEASVERALARALSAWRRKLFDGVTDETAQVLAQRITDRAYWQPVQEALEKQLREAALSGVEHAYGVYQSAVWGVKRADDPELLISGASNDAAEWARQYSFLLIRDLTAVRLRELQAEIAYFVENDLTITDLARRLERWFSPARARTIAITETTRAFARGSIALWQRQNVIKRHRWQTANDELVCPICAPLNQQVVEIGRPFAGMIDQPPAHPNCRCGVSPVVDFD